MIDAKELEQIRRKIQSVKDELSALDCEADPASALSEVLEHLDDSIDILSDLIEEA